MFCSNWLSSIFRVLKELCIVNITFPTPFIKNIVDDITIRGLGQAGHIKRMGEGRIPKNVLNGKFHNTR